MGQTETAQLRSAQSTAAYLAISERTLARKVACGELRPVRIGRMLRFESDEIARYVERQKAPRP